MISTRKFVVIIAFVLVFSMISILLMLRPTNEEKVAKVYINSELVDRIDLSLLEEPTTFTYMNKGHMNVIIADVNGVGVYEASCPDKLCVHQGKVLNGSIPIVCLPNMFVVEIEHKKTEIDVMSK